MNTFNSSADNLHLSPHKEVWIMVEFDEATRSNDYYISNFGNIKRKSLSTGHTAPIQGSVDNRGKRILNVVLASGRYKTIYIHKFVATHFLPQSGESNNSVIHLDFNKLNNHFKNLKWVSRKEWALHHKNNPYKKPYERKQTKHYKLKASDVIMIRKLLARGKVKKKVIAKQFGISITHVIRIEKNQNWSNIQDDNS